MVRLICFIIVASIGIVDTSYAQFDGNNDSSSVSRSSANPEVRVEKSDIREIFKKRQIKVDEGFVFAVSRVLGKDQKILLALNALAVHYIERGKIGLAKVVLSRALEAHPSSHTIHNNLGIIHLSENEQRKAINAFKKAIELKSDYEIGLANLGSIYVEYGDYPRAVEPLEEGYGVVRQQIKQRNEDAIKVASNYAVALAGTAQFEKAKGVYEEILEADSRNVGVLYNFASLLIENLQKAEQGRKVLSRLKFVADDKALLAKAKKLEAALEAIEEQKSQ